MAGIDKVKILVLGDSGVGKTSLVHLVCQNEPTTNPGWTIGCSVDVRLHEYKAGTASEKTYFVELWDIGGCTGHQNSRALFYNPVNGIILVHDLTNRKSQHNLRSWLAEVLRKDKSTGNGYDYDPEEFAGNQIPLLVIGTKLDQAENMRDKGKSRSSSVAEEFGADQFDLDCLNVKYLAPGSTNAVKLSRFFDKVIERRYYSREVSLLNVYRTRIDLKSQLSEVKKQSDNIENQIKIQNEQINLLKETVKGVNLNDNEETVQNATYKNENFLNQMKEEIVNVDIKQSLDESGAKPKLKKTSSLCEKSRRKIARVRRSPHTVPSDKEEQQRFNSFRRECLSKAIQWNLIDLLRAASELEDIVFPKWLCKKDSKFVMEGNDQKNIMRRFLLVLMKKDFGTMQEWLQYCGFDVKVLKQVWVTFEEFSNMNGSELKCFHCRLIENVDVLKMGDYLFSADVIGQEMYRKILESKLPVGAQEYLWKQFLLECEKYVQRYIVICALKVGLTDMQKSATDRVKPVYDSLLSDIEDCSQDLFLCKCSERCSQRLHPVSCLKAVSMAGVYLSPPAQRKREMSTSSEDVEPNVSPSSPIETTSGFPHEVTKPKILESSTPVEETKPPVETTGASRPERSVARRGTSDYSLETQNESRSLCKRRNKKIEVSSPNDSSSDSLDGEKRSAVHVKHNVRSVSSRKKVEKNPNVINAQKVVLNTGPQYHFTKGQNSSSLSDY